MSVTPWTAAIHTFDPDPETGKCRGSWMNDRYQRVNCLSSQRSSILHDDPEADHRERHWHDGGDCMCFESDDD